VNLIGQLFTGCGDFWKILKLVTGLRGRARTLEVEVALVCHLITQFSNSLMQPGNAKRGGSHIDSSHARAITEGYSENAYSPPRIEVSCALGKFSFGCYQV
jgi:hypothetical protein